MSYPYPPGQGVPAGAHYTQQPGYAMNYASPPAGSTVHYISTGQPFPNGPPPPNYYGQGSNEAYYGQPQGPQPGMVYGQPGGPPQQVIYQQAPAKNDGLMSQLCAGAMCATCCYCCLQCCDGLC